MSIDYIRNEGETELVWLPKALASKIEQQKKKGDGYEDIIIGYLDDSRAEVKNNLELLEDDVLQYRGLMVKAKQEFQKAKDEQLKASYDLWEKFDEELPKLRDKVEKANKELAPIAESVKDLRTSLDNISLYQLKELNELLESISRHLGNDGHTGKILKYLVKNYKAE